MAYQSARAHTASTMPGPEICSKHCAWTRRLSPSRSEAPAVSFGMTALNKYPDSIQAVLTLWSEQSCDTACIYHEWVRQLLRFFFVDAVSLET